MRTAGAVLLSLLLAIPVLGAVRDEPQPAPSFARVPDGAPSLGLPEWSLPPMRDSRRSIVPDSRPNPVIPSPHLIVVDRSGAGEGGTHLGESGDRRVEGRASWYCGHGSSPCTRGYPGGLYAAAGPTLRVGQWRGRTVHVVAGGASVDVVLIDWCACPNGRVLDLFSDAFVRLAPLSQGVVKVTVSW